MTMRLNHVTSGSHAKIASREPTRSLTDFAAMKKIHRETLTGRARKFSLPAPRFEIIKCGRVVPYYSLAELEKWHSDYEKSHNGKPHQ